MTAAFTTSYHVDESPWDVHSPEGQAATFNNPPDLDDDDATRVVRCHCLRQHMSLFDTHASC